MAGVRRDANARKSDSNTGWERTKEAYKLGEDEVSHAVVYDAETFHPGVGAPRPSYRQHYLGGQAWIELYFRVEIGGNPGEYVAVISAADGDSLDSRGQVSSVDMDESQRASKNPMFVHSVNFVQQGEGIASRLIPIPSLVRLHRIYDLPDIGPNTSSDVLESGVEEMIIRDQHDGETGTAFGSVSLSLGQGSGEFGKGVDDVIEGGSNLVTEFADSDTEVKEWWKARDEPAFVERLVRIEFTDHACWIERRVASEVFIDGFQMLMCPLELKERPFKRMRFTPALKFHSGAYSECDRRAETEDPEGPGDTRART